MLHTRQAVLILALLLGIGSAGVARADCIRSCTARLWVSLTYQPEGQTNVEKKTDPLMTTKTAVRDGRVGGMCLPHKIAEAKKRGCTEAVQDLLRAHAGGDRQMSAVCEAVANSETLIPRSNVRDELYPAADWYQIDQMFAKGKRDLISVSGKVRNIDRRRFQCEGGRAVASYPPFPPRGGTGPTPPPPPSHAGGTPAPPPSSNGSDDAAPPPPPSAVVGGRPDLLITELKLSPAEPVKRQPVVVRVRVYNRGTAPAGAFTVQWWPGENYHEPACTWNVEHLEARTGQMLSCRYSGYPSWYSRIMTKAVVDPANSITEEVENNNHRRMQISVAKP
jgi:hypothetical protein